MREKAMKKTDPIAEEIKSIKKTASETLSKCWPETFFIAFFSIGIPVMVYLLIYILAILTNSGVSYSSLPIPNDFHNPVFTVGAIIIAVTAYLASSPLYIGIQWFYLQLAGGDIMPVSSIFVPYKSREFFLKALKLRLIVALRRFFVIVPCIFVIDLVYQYVVCNVSIPDTLSDVIFGLCILLTIFILIQRTVKYLPSGYLIVEYTDSKSSDIIKMCREFYKSYSVPLLRLIISFAGLMILCLFMFPLLLLVPYMMLSIAIYIKRHIIGETDRDNLPDSMEKPAAYDIR